MNAQCNYLLFKVFLLSHSGDVQQCVQYDDPDMCNPDVHVCVLIENSELFQNHIKWNKLMWRPLSLNWQLMIVNDSDVVRCWAEDWLDCPSMFQCTSHNLFEFTLTVGVWIDWKFKMQCFEQVYQGCRKQFQYMGNRELATWDCYLQPWCLQILRRQCST